MKFVVISLLCSLAGVFAIDNILCMRNHSVLEVSGDAVLSVFIDTDYGPECNISSPKSIQEVAIALFVAQTLNKMEYVPEITIGLRLYDTCNDRVSVYKQALISAVEMDCSAYYDLGILAPLRYYDVLEPLRSLDLIPVNMYAPPNLTLPLIDALVDFVSTRYSTIDLVLASSKLVLNRFINVSKEAGICVKSDRDILVSSSDPNGTEHVIVAIGDFKHVYDWLSEHGSFADNDSDKKIWIVLPLDNSHIDDLLPDGSFVIKSEHFLMDIGFDFESPDLSQVPINTLLQSPHLLSIGKAIIAIVKQLKGIQERNCPSEPEGCSLPRFIYEEQPPLSNAEVYKILEIPATAHSTRYLVFQNNKGTMKELTSYRIDATSASYKVVAEKEIPKLPRLCVNLYEKDCDDCMNFRSRDLTYEEELPQQLGTLKSNISVPIFLTIMCCGTLICLMILAFIVYRYFVEDILDGNPTLTIILIFATLLLLTSIVPFCLEDETMGAEELNARKIYVSTLAFGLVFSVMLTRALFLVFSTGGVFSTHINGYLQGLMLFYMISVEISISTMYYIFSHSDSAEVMRSGIYIALLSYDIFLLILLFAVSCFIAPIQRNYREGMCFFGTTIGLVMCWSVWITCFFLMSADKRDTIVSYGILGTASLIIIGILVPRTYFMCRLTKDKDLIGRFEIGDLGPDPRMNNTARQALDLQSRQPFYDYVNGSSSQQLEPPSVNFYGSASPIVAAGGRRWSFRKRSPEPRRTPGYSNYGFRPEMRELDGPYVIPRLCVEDSDVSRIQEAPVRERATKSKSTTSTTANSAPKEARYALSRSLLRKKARGSDSTELKTGAIVHRVPDDDQPIREICAATEVYVQDRVSPKRLGPDERYPRRTSSPKLTPTHTTIREEEEMMESLRITRF